MSVYVTGDTHGGFQRLGMKYFPEQKKMNREDMVIIAGDFGGLWGGTPAEEVLAGLAGGPSLLRLPSWMGTTRTLPC